MGWWVRGWHGRCRLGRARRLRQDGGLLIGAGSGRELDKCLWLSRAGWVPVVQETRAGVVSRTGPTVVSSLVVEVMSIMGVVVLFRAGELEGTLAGVMERIEGSMEGSTSASVVNRGWWGRVDGGEGFERLVEAVVEQPSGAGEEQAGARLHQPCCRLPAELLLSGQPALSLQRNSSEGWRRFSWSPHLILPMRKGNSIHESHTGSVTLTSLNKKFNEKRPLSYDSYSLSPGWFGIICGCFPHFLCFLKIWSENLHLPSDWFCIFANILGAADCSYIPISKHLVQIHSHSSAQSCITLLTSKCKLPPSDCRGLLVRETTCLCCRIVWWDVSGSRSWWRWLMTPLAYPQTRHKRSYYHLHLHNWSSDSQVDVPWYCVLRSCNSSADTLEDHMLTLFYLI